MTDPPHGAEPSALASRAEHDTSRACVVLLSAVDLEIHRQLSSFGFALFFALF